MQFSTAFYNYQFARPADSTICFSTLVPSLGRNTNFLICHARYGSSILYVLDRPSITVTILR